MNSTVDNFHQNMKPLNLARYIKTSSKSAGGYGKVFAIIEKATDHLYAAKTYEKDFYSLEFLVIFYREIEIMSQLDSPFIVKYIGYSLKDFDGNKNPTIIMEYVPNGSLKAFLEKDSKGLGHHRWDETKKLIFIYGIAKGMSNLHSKNILHRDLKPENILIDEYFYPKICDFNLSVIANDANLLDHAGTPVYLAPELFQDTGKHSKASDVYAFALIVYHILTGKTHFEDFGNNLPEHDIYTKISKGEMPKLASLISRSFKRLITKCWALNPKDRPSFDEIVTLLKTDKGFINEMVDEGEYINFVDYVEKYDNVPKYEFNKVQIDYSEERELIIDADIIDLALFEKVQFIGEGKFGDVFKTKEKSTEKICAAKINKLELHECDNIQIKCLSREINILSKLESPFILKYIGYNPKNFENEPKPTMITEYTKNGSLDNILELYRRGLKPAEWDDTKILITAYGIASGMAYLHSKNILHRDLKPANVFMDEYLFPKIGDFGLSKELTNDASSSNVGSPAYMSPEILCKLEYTKAGDVYAYSILLYEMITCDIPYKGFNFFQVIGKVPKGIRPTFNDEIPACYKNLIEQCWSQDPEKRPSFDEIVDLLKNNDEFITDDVDENEFLKYVKSIECNKIDESFHPVNIDFSELKRKLKNDRLNISYIDLGIYEKQRLIRRINGYQIFEIKNIETDVFYEAKISIEEITNLTRTELIHLSREINIISQINHPSFLKFIGYSPIDFEQNPKPVIVNEIPQNKSLAQLLYIERYENHNIQWDDTKKLICIYGIAAGMAFLHLYDIIHRDLSPESIFFDDFLFPKIGNFGLLTKIHTMESITYQSSIGVKGNFIYSSPELLETSKYSKSNDVYAFALIVYEIMTLEIPFNEINDYNSLYNAIINHSKRPMIDDEVPNAYRQLINECWSQNPEDRPTFSEIVSVLKSNNEFITKDVKQEEFLRYVQYIENYDQEYYSRNPAVHFDSFIREINNINNLDFENANDETNLNYEASYDSKNQSYYDLIEEEEEEEDIDEKHSIKKLYENLENRIDRFNNNSSEHSDFRSIIDNIHDIIVYKNLLDSIHTLDHANMSLKRIENEIDSFINDTKVKKNKE